MDLEGVGAKVTHEGRVESVDGDEHQSTVMLQIPSN